MTEPKKGSKKSKKSRKYTAPSAPETYENQETLPLNKKTKTSELAQTDLSISPAGETKLNDTVLEIDNTQAYQENTVHISRKNTTSLMPNEVLNDTISPTSDSESTGLEDESFHKLEIPENEDILDETTHGDDDNLTKVTENPEINIDAASDITTEGSGSQTEEGPSQAQEFTNFLNASIEEGVLIKGEQLSQVASYYLTSPRLPSNKKPAPKKPTSSGRQTKISTIGSYQAKTDLGHEEKLRVPHNSENIQNRSKNDSLGENQIKIINIEPPEIPPVEGENTANFRDEYDHNLHRHDAIRGKNKKRNK